MESKTAVVICFSVLVIGVCGAVAAACYFGQSAWPILALGVIGTIKAKF